MEWYQRGFWAEYSISNSLIVYHVEWRLLCCVHFPSRFLCLIRFRSKEIKLLQMFNKMMLSNGIFLHRSVCRWITLVIEPYSVLKLVGFLLLPCASRMAGADCRIVSPLLLTAVRNLLCLEWDRPANNPNRNASYIYKWNYCNAISIILTFCLFR
jgi:hypothetical protein